MFSEKVIPSDWSDIIVEPIHKKWNKLDPAKYRAYSYFQYKEGFNSCITTMEQDP